MSNWAAVFVVLALQGQQGYGLLDAARRNGGTTHVTIDVDLGFLPFDTMVTESVVIVRGTIRGMTPRLSDDEKRVVTRFEVIPVRIYKGDVGPTTNKPGPTQPVIVQRSGGELTIGGLTLRTFVSIYPESEWFQEGEDVFVFLSLGESKGVFAFTGGAYGAYRIANGQVTAMTKETAMARSAQPEAFAAFENRVLSLIKK